MWIDSLFVALNVDLLATFLGSFHNTNFHQLIVYYLSFCTDFMIAKRHQIALTYFSLSIRTDCLSFFNYFLCFFPTHLLSEQLFVTSSHPIGKTLSSQRLHLRRLRDCHISLFSHVYSLPLHLEPQWVNPAMMSQDSLLPSWPAWNDKNGHEKCVILLSLQDFRTTPSQKKKILSR